MLHNGGGNVGDVYIRSARIESEDLEEGAFLINVLFIQNQRHRPANDLSLCRLNSDLTYSVFDRDSATHRRTQLGPCPAARAPSPTPIS